MDALSTASDGHTGGVESFQERGVHAITVNPLRNTRTASSRYQASRIIQMVNQMRPDYRTMFPKANDTQVIYASRLENEGHEEMFIRKALRIHFAMETKEFGAFFERFDKARLRHLTLLSQIHPNRTDYSLIRKVSRNLGISSERAEYWVKRFRETGAVPFVGTREG